MPSQSYSRPGTATRPSDQVRTYLLREITSGSLSPGQKLPTERALADRFEVSRTVVRDALTLLEAEMRIVRHVGRGTFVAGTTSNARSVADGVAIDTSPIKLLEARNVIESELAALAVLNATDADIRTIAAACAALRRAESSPEFESLDAAFHAAIAAATHNDLLSSAYELISLARNDPEWRKLKERRHLARPERREEVYREHQLILEALADRNAAAARRAMQDHLVHVRVNLLGC